VPLLASREVLDVGRFITDAWLARAKRSGCTRGQVAPLYALRVFATRLPDGSLLRMRGSPDVTTRTTTSRDGTIAPSGGYFDVVRDWPGGGGVRIGTWDIGGNTFWVLRYADPPNARLSDDRAVTDAEAASMLAILQRQFAALDCPPKLNRKVDFGDQVPLWERRSRDGWEWRDEWPRRPLGGR
jgi:hypothetical protein